MADNWQICLFWFAWTANRTSWVSPVVASAFFGLGATWSFMPILTYLPHTYPEYVASVLASNDFFRSMLGEWRGFLRQSQGHTFMQSDRPNGLEQSLTLL